MPTMPADGLVHPPRRVARSSGAPQLHSSPTRMQRTGLRSLCQLPGQPGRALRHGKAARVVHQRVGQWTARRLGGRRTGHSAPSRPKIGVGLHEGAAAGDVRAAGVVQPAAPRSSQHHQPPRQLPPALARHPPTCHRARRPSTLSASSAAFAGPIGHWERDPGESTSQTRD